MLFVILDNGDFVGLVSAPADAPMLEYMREFGEASPEFIGHLLDKKKANHVDYNVIHDPAYKSAAIHSASENKHELYVILTDRSLWAVVRGVLYADMEALIEEYDGLEEVGELHEFLAEKGFEHAEPEVIEGMDALGPTHYAQTGMTINHRVFLN